MHADFGWCGNLTDAAVIAMINGFTQLDGNSSPWGLDKRLVTDAAVLELADKCRGLTHVDFRLCTNLTDAAVLALAVKCPGITHADFYGCWNLTDAAVIAMSDDKWW